MELRTFGIETLVIECVFSDSKGREVQTKFILNEKETCKLTVEYAESCTNLSIIDWIKNEIGGVVSVEGVRNFLNDLEIESEMYIDILE